MKDKRKLFILAGVLWLFAGIMVMLPGIKALIEIKESNHMTKLALMIILALIVYVVFYLFVFSKLVVKHQIRIMEKEKGPLKWWQFFDKKSYIIMIVMMSTGMILRITKIVPNVFFAFFYTGLGFALFSCGIRFIYLFYKYPIDYKSALE